MDYFKLFQLEKEPFANTPDPDFFYHSTRHTQCLQKVELAIRLRRGLCIVCGEVGTGKTTLCRQLIRTLADDAEMDVHLVLDPGYDSTQDFAAAINEMTNGVKSARSCATAAEHKEMIKNHLFEAGVNHNQNIVLIIDEGQKLPAGCAEFLRELLNYETNDSKLLQIVIFAQNEIHDLLDAHPGFADRIALFHRLEPLDRRETKELIAHRLKKAGSSPKQGAGPYFTKRAVSRIHRISRGYPRTIIHLGHHVLLLLLIKGGTRVDPGLVSRAAAGLAHVRKQTPGRFRPGIKTLAGTAAICLIAAGMGAYALWPVFSGPENRQRVPAVSEAHVPGAHQTHTPEKASPPADQGMRLGNKPPPEVLGRIRINENDNLWEMIGLIYGTSNPGAFVETVLGLNPHIKDPNQIRPGQEIRLPAAGALQPQSKQRFWIAQKTSDTLDPVYRLARTKADNSLRVLSYWDPESGICHAVVHRQSFPTRDRAAAAMETLGPETEKPPFILDLKKDGLFLLSAGQGATNR